MSRPILSYDSAARIAETTVGDMLVRITTEIDLAAGAAGDLQSVLSPLLTQSGASLSQKIQGLDLLEQTLRDLGAVLTAIASTPAASRHLDGARVLERCKLSAVAARLSGAEAEALSDELELF